MSVKRLQPEWSTPVKDVNAPVLKLYNSLTRQKEEFVPQNAQRVTWYNCGPTVYDASHMGHARTYLTFDIVRRVLQDYFGYNVFYCMNVTDIDDKIIKRARQNHLYELYLQEKKPSNQILSDCNDVLSQFGDHMKATTDVDRRAMQERQYGALSEAVSNVEESSEGGDEATLREAEAELIVKARDLLSDWLDKRKGSEVTENGIFSKLPQYWEEQYHKDMEALNVLPPDCLTRVSEYVPEIVEFIGKVIERGYAYESNGSVYFDVAKFDGHEAHHYAKLVPEAFGDQGALQEGEGDLSVCGAKEKRSGNDFALWKDSKAGEPSWDSPWGKGRPGWHIECSVMASAILGKSIDIHSGGVDLKFPHHDNELAQAEAYFDNDNWIRYFLHSGHLTIAGCKMSKSLKNFITIQQVLEKYTARQLRLMFLLHNWKDTLDYSDSTMETAKSYEKSVNELFLKIKHILRATAGTGVEAFKKWGDKEVALNNHLLACEHAVHVAFCDNIDTRTALMSIRELVAQTNGYIEAKGDAIKDNNRALLGNVAAYFAKIFNILGLMEAHKKIGFSTASGSEVDTEELVMPYLEAVASFRDIVRKEARSLKATSILNDCDRLRDDILPNLGVRLEDKENQPTVIKLVDKNELLKEREEKLRQEEKKRLEKENKKSEALAKQALLDAQKKIPPWEMFKGETDRFSKFDEKGFPTHDGKGELLAKAQVKKLQKMYSAQEKKYADYLASSNEG